MKMPCKLLAAAVLSVGAASFAAPAGAAPIAAPSSLRNAAAPSVETVQWRRWGWAPGVAAGAIIGGAIAAAQPWNWGYYNSYAYAPGYAYGYEYAPGYADGPGYTYAPGYAYSPGYAYGQDYAYAPGYAAGYGGGNDAAYCAQRFRSYDRASGTYMGFDGRRHPCP
jgi:hypothetical protein